MPIVSIIIPSRNEIFLQKTVTDLLTKARGEIEVIVILDGYWPTPPLIDDERLKIIHRGTPMGMRAAINAGATIAKGKFLMKCDAHCMFAEGFDMALVADCKDEWVMVPRRYALDPEKWELIDNPKYPTDYMYLSPELHGVVWNEKNKDPKLKEKLIDETMSNQGSVWFMPKKYFEFLELMDEDTYGTFWNEFQEIGLKCWLSGGRVMVNKKTWYAHWHKTEGRGYSMSSDDKPKALETVAKWLDKGWHKQTLPLSWLIDRFRPVPGWPETENKKDAIKYITDKYKLDLKSLLPITIPDFNRSDLALLFSQLGFTKGAEIGVFSGRFSRVLCEANRNLKLYAIDPWQKHSGYNDSRNQQEFDHLYKRVTKGLSKFNCDIIRKKSMEAVKEFPDGSLDFVYIDGNHEFASEANDIHEWSKKVRPGGIIAGHDYRRYPKSSLSHSFEVVNAYTAAYRINPWFITDHGKEQIRSWFWIKSK